MWKIYVSEGLKEEVMKKNHDDPLGANLGVLKIQQRKDGDRRKETHVKYVKQIKFRINVLVFLWGYRKSHNVLGKW